MATKKTSKKVVVESPNTYILTLSKTADGQRQYLQILSRDGFETNIVLIADVFVVNDHRED